MNTVGTSALSSDAYDSLIDAFCTLMARIEYQRRYHPRTPLLQAAQPTQLYLVPTNDTTQAKKSSKSTPKKSISKPAPKSTAKTPKKSVNPSKRRKQTISLVPQVSTL